MSIFVLHFFKEKTREFDYEKLLSFFDEIPETKVQDASEESTELRILYRHPVLQTKADFVISRKSTVSNIHMLDPQFLDVNFRLEIPLFTPNFSASFIFEIVKELANEFSFAVYNILFENVLQFKMEVIKHVFALTKQQYKEKYGYQLENVYYYPETKLNACLKYINEQYDLHRYYNEQKIYVPNYLLAVDEEGKVFFNIDWQEGKPTVFPPHLDYIYYRSGLNTKIISYDEVIAKIEKFTQNVPGFIENTKVIDTKMVKKVVKVLRKTKFSSFEKTLIRIDINQVIDI